MPQVPRQSPRRRSPDRIRLRAWATTGWPDAYSRYRFTLVTCPPHEMSYLTIETLQYGESRAQESELPASTCYVHVYANVHTYLHMLTSVAASGAFSGKVGTGFPQKMRPIKEAGAFSGKVGTGFPQKMRPIKEASVPDSVLDHGLVPILDHVDSRSCCNRIPDRAARRGGTFHFGQSGLSDNLSDNMACR